MMYRIQFYVVLLRARIFFFRGCSVGIVLKRNFGQFIYKKKIIREVIFCQEMKKNKYFNTSASHVY